MEKLNEEIDRRLKEIYEEFKKDKNDLTGWSLNQKLKEESSGNEALLDYLCYRMQIIAYRNKEIISNLLADFIIYPFFEEEYLGGRNHKDIEVIEFLPNIFFKKGIKTKVLESLGLNKTLNAYYSYLVYFKEKFKGKEYSKEELLKFSNWEDASKEISKVLMIELDEKFGEDKPRILDLSNSF